MIKIHIFKSYLFYYYSFLRGFCVAYNIWFKEEVGLWYLLMEINLKRYIGGHKRDYIVPLSIGNLEVKLPEHQRKMGDAILIYVDVNGVW